MLLVSATPLFYFSQKGPCCFQADVFWCHAWFRDCLSAIYRGCRWFGKECQCITRRSNPERLLHCQYWNWHTNVLSTFVPFINIGVEINIGNVAIQYWARSFYHPVWELRVYSNSMAENFSLDDLDEDFRTYATPRIRLILPGSTKFRVLTCFTIGHRNWISPPPAGAAPRFFILISFQVSPWNDVKNFAYPQF